MTYTRTLFIVTVVALAVNRCEAQKSEDYTSQPVSAATESAQDHQCVSVDGTPVDCGRATAIPVDGGTIVDNDTPSGSVDGINVNFQLAGSPTGPQGVYIFRNGALLKAGTDYDIAGDRISFRACCVPAPGDSLVATYRSGGAGPASLETFVDQLLRDAAVSEIPTSPERLRDQHLEERVPVAQASPVVANISRGHQQESSSPPPRSLRLLMERNPNRGSIDDATVSSRGHQQESSFPPPRSLRLLTERDANPGPIEKVTTIKQNPFQHVEIVHRRWILLPNKASHKITNRNVAIPAPDESNTTASNPSSPIPRSLRLLRSRESSHGSSEKVTREDVPTGENTEGGTTSRALRLLQLRLERSSTNQEKAQ